MAEIVTEKDEEVVLNQEHPWPGIDSFTETNHSFFFGREREVSELLRLVRQETLTVFFGKSGLGKTSLLRAGLSPGLRGAGLIPIYIRLNHDETEPPLTEQVKNQIATVLEAEEIDAPKPVPEKSLWEYFHKKGNDWWDANNRLVSPVLIFDQFEELMTLGQENADRAGRTADFLNELEDLIENRPPASLLQRFKEEPDLADQIDHRKTDYRVILSLREDFLPDLEGLRDRLRSIMLSRLRLLPMNGNQGLDVILKPGGHLVDEDVAVRIVDFVSSSERSRLQKQVNRAQIAKRTVEPALLSVVLRELNNRRIQQGHEKITADLIGKANSTEIIRAFYLRGLAGMDGAVREFIEDSLLTSSGARNRIAEEDALTKPGISSEIVAKLIDRRIIQRESTGNTKWLELTHDTLADVVRTERIEHRQQRELELSKARENAVRLQLTAARRRTTIAVALLAVTIVACIGALVAYLMAVSAKRQALLTQRQLSTTNNDLWSALKDTFSYVIPVAWNDWQNGSLARFERDLQALEQCEKKADERGQHLGGWESDFFKGLLEMSKWTNRRLVGHNDNVEALLFIPDPWNPDPKEPHEVLVSAGYDRTVRVWDVAEHGVISRDLKPRTRGQLGFSYEPKDVRKDNRYVITDLVPNSPAAQDGHIKPPTWITQISGPDGVLLSASDADPATFTRLTRGQPGTRLQLEIRNWNETAKDWYPPQQIELTRAKQVDEWRSDEVIHTLQSVPNSRYLFAAGDTYLGFWDGAQWGRITEPAGSIHRQVALLPGREDPLTHTRLVIIAECSGRDKNVTLLYPKEGKTLVVANQDSTVTAIAVAPDGRLATGTDTGIIKIWDSETYAKELWTNAATGKPYPCDKLTFTPDGRLLIALINGRVKIFELGKKETKPLELRDDPSSAERGLALSRSGRYLATGSMNGLVQIWSTKDGTLRRSFTHTSPVIAVAFSDDGRYLASAGTDQVIRLWDLACEISSSYRTIEPKSYENMGLAFSPDGRLLAAADPYYSDNAGRVTIFDAANLRIIKEMQGGTRRFQFSPKGSILPVPQKGGSIQLFDLSDPSMPQKVGKPLEGDGKPIRAVAFSPDGGKLVSGSEGGTVSLWDLGSPDHPQRKLAEKAGKVGTVAFSPTRPQVAATIPEKDKVILFDLQGQRQPREFVAATWGYSLQFSPDGQLLVAGDRDGPIHAWDVESGQDRPFLGHSAYALDLAISPDAEHPKRMVSAGYDRTLRLWDLATRRELAILNSERSYSGAAFSPDGFRLAATDGERVYLWDAALFAAPIPSDPAKAAQLHGIRALYHHGLGEEEAAIQDINAAFASSNAGESNDAQLRLLHGRAAMQSNQPNLAQADYETLDRAVNDPNVFAQTTTAMQTLDWLCLFDLQRLRSGDTSSRDKYFAHVQKLNEAAQKDPSSPVLINNAAWFVSLLESSTFDLKPIIDRTKEMAEKEQNDYNLQGSYGTLLYRAGRFPEAIQQMKKAMELKQNKEGTAFEWIVLAMANWKMGNQGEAMRYLEKTEDRYNSVRGDRFLVEDPNYDWRSWSDELELDLLLNEAKNMIEAKKRDGDDHL